MAWEWLSISFPLSLWTGHIVEGRSWKASTFGELEDPQPLCKGVVISHADFEKGIITVVAPFLIPHSDELNYSTQTHQAHDLVDPAFGMSRQRISLDLVFDGSFNDFSFTRTAQLSWLLRPFRHGDYFLLLHQGESCGCCAMGLIRTVLLCVSDADSVSFL